MRRLAVVARASARSLAVLCAVFGPSAAHAQTSTRVGYYDMTQGRGVTTQVAPIVLLGSRFTPVALEDLTPVDLAGIDVLFVQNANILKYGAEYMNRLPAIQAAVNGGMVLVVHDRKVLDAGSALPGGGRISVVVQNSSDIDVTDRGTLVANGPLGIITNTTLDGGTSSAHGWATLSTLPAGAKSLLYADGSTSKSVTFSYPYGSGFVVYSTIPLDYYLSGFGPAAVNPNFTKIYGPNVIAYASALRTEKLTVEPATGQYGGTTTFTATLMAGTTPRVGEVIEFALNGSPVGRAVTDSEGVATLANVSLSPDRTPIPAGRYAGHVRASFNAVSQTSMLTVLKAPATVAVARATFVYDGLPHAASATATGVVNEPLPSPAITYTAADGVTSSEPPVAAGTYTVNATSAELANYLSTTNSSHTVTITPAPLTVQANDKTRLYGEANPNLAVVYSGLVNGEGPDVLGGTLVLTTAATGTSDAGVYAITPDGLTASNYAISFVAGTLTVNPAPLTVTADSVSKRYSETLPSFAATYAGFVLGQDRAVLAGALTFSTPATAASDVGVYPITPGGLAARNYAITFVNGTLTVTPASLTVTADDSSKLLGAPLPAFTARYSGFVLGQGPSVLAGTLTFSTPATPSSPVGTYAVTPGGLSSSNYAIEFTPATLTVTYNVCLLYDPSRRHNSGSTIPLRLRLCNASGSNVSSSSTLVEATSIVQVSTTSSGDDEESGTAYPDGNFKYSDGSYRFNLKTSGSMDTGTYNLRFTVSGDPAPHAVPFQIR